MPRTRPKPQASAATSLGGTTSLREITQLLVGAGGPLVSALNDAYAGVADNLGGLPQERSAAVAAPRDSFADGHACACARCRRKVPARVDDPRSA